MRWSKIQKLEYLQNGMELFYEIEKSLTCASDDTFEEVILLWSLKLTLARSREVSFWKTNNSFDLFT